MPFVAKFCPAKFGWNAALILNFLQWAVECGFVSEASNYLCSLTGSEADADLLSMFFVREQSYLIETLCNYALDVNPFRGYRRVERMDAVMRQEFLEVFTHGLEPHLLGTGITTLFTAVSDLRMELYQSCCNLDPVAPFAAVFSPFDFGWRNALVLNCLQRAYEDSVNRNDAAYWYSVRFTNIVGSHTDAEWLSRVFDGKSIRYVRDILSEEFASEGVMDVQRELVRLRRSLAAIPRSIAFLMGTHRRVGAGSPIAALGNEMCQLILAQLVE